MVSMCGGCWKVRGRYVCSICVGYVYMPVCRGAGVEIR